MNDLTIIGAGCVFIGIFTSPWLIVLGVIIAIAGLAGC